MKYIKYGMVAITAQSINAGCGCCARKKALDEICKYFGVSKDHVLLTITEKLNEDGASDPSKHKETIEKTIEKANKLIEKNNKLKLQPISKIICKERKVIYFILLSETYNVNTNEVTKVDEKEYRKAIKNKEDVVFYLVGGSSGAVGIYKKK